ncbi:MAG: hypothetical protein WKF75_15855, partial [Singulisphaera sp.]
QSLDRVLHELGHLRRRGPSPVDADSRCGPDLSVSIARGLLSGRFPDEDAETQPTIPIDGIPAPVHDPASSTKDPTGGPSPIVLGDHSELGGQSATAYSRSVARVGVQVAEALAYSHQQGSSTATSGPPTSCSIPGVPSGSATSAWSRRKARRS